MRRLLVQVRHAALQYISEGAGKIGKSFTKLVWFGCVLHFADMSELEDEADLKSADSNIVWVQIPLSAVLAAESLVYQRFIGCES